jgi:hypothetical protein
MENNRTPIKNKVKPEILDFDAPVIYCDQITTFSIGPAISKLQLTLEVDTAKLKPVATIAIPTPSLIQALNFMITTISDNKEFSDKLLSEVDKFKSMLEGITNDAPDE